MSTGQRRIPSKSETQSAKDKFLADLLEKEGVALPKSQKIYPRQTSKYIALSFAQERFWFLDQLEPGLSVYNISRAHRLIGPLDVGGLTKSLNEVVARHEILRTTFPTIDGFPVQQVSRTLTLNILAVDLEKLSRSDLEMELSRIILEEARYSFNLSHGPLIKATLLRLGRADQVLVITAHQIICDGRSVDLLFRELEIAYGSLSNARSAALPELPVQYGDFALWQRQWLQGEVLESQLSFWRNWLGGMSPVLQLPTDHPRPPIQTFRGARKRLALPRLLTRMLKDLGRQRGATLFMVLMSAFNTLLYRYTAQQDIFVGFPIANRDLSEIQDLIGFFVNTLVLRTSVSGNLTFTELLSRVRKNCQSAYAHQDLPFEKAVLELQRHRDLTRNPLFQVMFGLQSSSNQLLCLPGLASEAVEVDTGASKFDLTLSLTECNEQLRGFMEYSTDLFDHSTIERMIGHFQILLEGIVENPDQRLSDLPLFTEAERYQLLNEWNNTKAAYPAEKCVHELFEAQAEQTPDVVAVVIDKKQLSYRELNERANQLAHYLRQLGIGPDTLVGIFLERSLEMVVGLLGVLKAGGAYIPLDPAFPGERLAFISRDAGISILLTENGLLESTRDLSSTAQLICLDRDWDEIALQSHKNPEEKPRSQNLAYVIYTSGSTGRPKGVQIAHRSVVNCLHSVAQNIRFTEEDILLSVTTISFDIAALELYLPLLTGARVVLASRDEVLDGNQLAEKLSSSGATMMQATPSAWKLLGDAGWRGREGFKILCGGEVLSRSLADQLLEGGAELWNLYGPTETTIWSAMAKIEPGEGPVLIGRPIANTRIYILDSYLQPVPVGVYGELYIGGDGLARGYLNRPELTAEKFIPDPLSDRAEARLYRTGDRARYRSDGIIEFLGRADNQVKIRGHRIELGEIESLLNQHPAVKESVVIASSFAPPRPGRTEVGAIHSANSVREEAHLSLPSPSEGEGVSESDRTLIAYLVSNAKKPLPTELRGFLSQKLPEYMIPSAFVVLDGLPLTPNGKIDRSKLSPCDDSRPGLDRGFIEPRSEIEELIAQVWQEVLKLERIGVFDNFFELGGHSLMATRVVGRLCSNFDIDLPLRKLFELPTVAGLAQHVDFLRCHQRGISLPPIRPVSRDRVIPLSFSQLRLWFLHKVDSNLTAYNIPATFSIKGVLNTAVLQRALNAIVNRHEILRTRITESDGQPRQKIIESLILALPVIDHSRLPAEQAEEELNRLLAEDACQSYRLEQAPLMRAKLLKLGEQEHVLMLNFHHLVCDGSSLIIFYRELASIYEMLLNGQASNLPSLPVQFADYAAWQQNQLQREVLKSQLAYWKRQLGRGSTAPNLPADHHRPAMQSYHGKKLTRVLAADLTTALKELSRKEGVTLFMTLLASLDIVLSRHIGQDDVIVGSTIAGRNRPEVDGLIGFFINALALRVDLSGNPTFQNLLKRVREVCLDAYTHQDLPFEKVVEEINPQRDLSRNPLFQVMFNMADTSERTLTLPGCAVTKLSSAEPSAKFDIVLHAPEIDGCLEFAIVYNADLFSEDRITVLLDELSCLLSQIVEKPDRSIHEYSLVTRSARAILPKPAEPLDSTWQGAIHTIVGKHADRMPEHFAVIDADERWTYSELDSQSSQLANYLMDRGVQPKDIVAIYAHRSGPLVLSLLGILKAGAAFTIIDPAYPSSRLMQYLRIAKPKGWMQMTAAGELPDGLQSLLDDPHLRCRMKLPKSKEAMAEFLAEYSKSEQAGVAVSADDPAYVAFTSGSTGEPKGVVGRHGPISHFLPWQNEAFELRKSDRFCLLSGLGYNHLQRDVFTALALGATLYIPAPDLLESPDRLTQWLEQHEITILHLTPALGRLLRTMPGKTLSSLRRVFFGGDLLTRQDVWLMHELAPNAKIVSFYGATETQRAVGYYAIPEYISIDQSHANRPIPLGRGAKNVQLLLFAAGGQLAGIGELGELYVRSPHLAHGYMADDDLTAQSFIKNPFTNETGDRLYRTGDLGRYLPDGNVEWAGRNDRRVSIRGFRVELAEIEAALSQHDAVASSAVIARVFTRPDGQTELRSLAYVEAQQRRSASVEELRCFLNARLPSYMVPAHIVIVGHLPLNPNGKVDLLRLPEPDWLLLPGEEEFEAPLTAIEQALAKIFSEVLGIERIGRQQNFFHLGGHSLLAAQLVTRLRESLNITVDLRTFLETPTVESLGRQIDMLQAMTRIAPPMSDMEREEVEI